MLDEYATILIRVYAKDEVSKSYPIEATLDDGNFFRGGEMRVQEELLMVSQLDPQAYGLLLFNALFDQPVRDAYNTVAARAGATTEGRVRVKLWIDDGAAELHALPWERLYHVHKGQLVPLSTSTATPFSRYTPMRNGEPRAITQSPIRLLYAIANPSDLEGELRLAPVDVEQEVETVQRAVADLQSGNPIEVTVMPGRTGLSPDLQSRLEGGGYRVLSGATTVDALVRALPTCDVFHFVGHGSFQVAAEGDGGTAALHLEREDGTWQPVTDDELVAKLVSAHPLPRLVFLAACESAKRDAQSKHPFVGLGPKLVQAGVPAVIAMQDQVPMDLARRLTGDFYRNLLLHGQVDLALNQARLLLFETAAVDWAIPVLFSRLVDNELVDLPAEPSLKQSVDLVAAAEKVLAAVRPQEQGREIVEELERLLQEWQKSYQSLVELESALRRTGNDPETFAREFESFYQNFKDYYNLETWADEDALIRAAMRLRDQVLPQMRPTMDPKTFAQAQQALNLHVGTRGMLVSGFGEFLDAMDEAVMQIRQQVDNGNIAESIGRKRQFEVEIASSLRNSRKLLRQMSGQVTTVDGLMSRLEAQQSEDQVVGSRELMDTVLVQGDRQGALDEISQKLVTVHGVDDQVLQQPGAVRAAAHIGSQIDQVMAAQRGMSARGLLPAPHTLQRMGMLAAYGQDYESALGYFREATRADPAYAESFQSIAWLQQSLAMQDVQTGSYDTALDRLAEARTASNHIESDRALIFQGYIAKTQAQIALGQNQAGAHRTYLQEAAQLFEQSLELKPDSAEALNGLGNVHALLGNYDGAIAAYEQAIELYPNYAAAHHDLGAACMAKMEADPAQAVTWCRRGIQAFETALTVAGEHDPLFSPAYREQLRGYISSLRGRCG